MNMDRALFISLILHLVLYWVLQFGHSSQLESTSSNKVEVVLLQPEQQKQMIRQVSVPESLKDQSSDKKAKFMSEKTQRVLQETRVQETGLTQNGSRPLSANKIFKGSHQKELLQKRLDELQGDKEDSRKTSEPITTQVGRSQVGESLPETISIGSFTSLNTDAYLYYTFFSRVEEAIRFRWETRIWKALNQFSPVFLRSTVAKKAWNTQAIFYLDARGYLVKSALVQDSGLVVFDQAAIESFKEVQIFPNPPKELIKEDGFIHLKYSFTVNYGI